VHPQLRRVEEEFVRALARLRRLATVDDPGWTERRHPDRWAAAECVAHLNLTSAAYLTVLADGLARAERLPAGPPRRYRHDPVGWILWKTMGPPVRLRTKTTAPFVPGATEGREEVVAAFERLQEEQLRCVERADGLAIDRVRVPSPFNPRVTYNLYACLSILPRHQERHLWQAERALVVDARPSSGAAPTGEG
jgi:hypothetical protein